MTNLQKVFNYEGNQVRTVMMDGQPWFVAKDVCNVLDIINPTSALGRLDNDEKRTYNAAELTLDSTEGQKGGARYFTIVNEPGLYSLILGSRKPEAKAFKRWVVHEVLPSIRQTGSYSVTNEERPTFEGRLIPQNYVEALDALVQTEKMRLELVAKVETDAPKVDAFNAFIESRGWQTMSEVAKSMEEGRNNTYAALREEGILIKSGMDKNLPLQKYIERGYFMVKEYTFWKDGQLMTRSRTLVSPKGVEFIRTILKRRKEIA
ncbi:phage antirepressor Ant [Heliobacillus mobilis]|uniref:Phage antirepressor Ant n=1 Tax=Heliobacterium mobile TaxID=28064 RepID=A0A6I3SP15_HELMO|nr:phage antirepressor KilAC domain-containing protein [Heliobacterium mobile]MTV50771.1 phage antirepressor Ant [Heliobacterium mobile]